MDFCIVNTATCSQKYALLTRKSTQVIGCIIIVLLDMERPCLREKDIGKGEYAYYELLPNPHSSNECIGDYYYYPAKKLYRGTVFIPDYAFLWLRY